MTRRRWLVAALAVFFAVAVTSFGFAPLVRARAEQEARARGLRMAVGHVRPIWFGVALRDVELGGRDVLHARIANLRVEFGFGIRPKAIHAERAHVELIGDLDTLRQQLHPARNEPSNRSGVRTALFVEGLTGFWRLGNEPGSPTLKVSGVDGAREPEGTHLHIGSVELEDRKGQLLASSVRVELSAQDALRHMLVDSAEAAVDFARGREMRSDVYAPSALPSPPPLPPNATAPLTARHGRPRAPSAPSPSTGPMFTWPDLSLWRAVIAAAANAVAGRLPEASSVEVRALSLALKQNTALVAFPPGRATVAREAEALLASFHAPGQNGHPPIILSARLPTGAGDVTLDFQGGPVPLSVLQLRSASGAGQGGRAVGRGRLVLADAGRALSFDAALGIEGMAVYEPAIAPEPIEKIDLQLELRGALDAAGELRLDEARVGVGALHARIQGRLAQTADHTEGRVSFGIDAGDCHTLFESIPAALVPTLRGATLRGTFEAAGRLAFDSRALDDLVLDYKLRDQCHFSHIPEPLAPQRFSRAFEHRVYHPDGSVGDEVTGPGTPRWTPLERISPFVQIAVLTTEDGAFYRHRGFNHSAIRDSLIANLKARRFVRGASTVTMQLAKNLFLSRDKTFSRKLEELLITEYLEDVFEKRRLLELYLNVIEFGPDIYGIAAAADHYFGRKPEELNLVECMFLTSLLPAPLRFHRLWERGEVPDSWMNHLRQLMTIAEHRALISSSELSAGLEQHIEFFKPKTARPSPRPPARAEHLPDEHGRAGARVVPATSSLAPEVPRKKREADLHTRPRARRASARSRD